MTKSKYEPANASLEALEGGLGELMQTL